MSNKGKSSKNAEDIAKNAAENTLALNPLVGVRSQDFAAAGTNVMRAMMAQPALLAQEWMSFASEFSKIVTNSSEIAPSPKDRRFADTAWKNNNISKAMMQSYIAWSDTVMNTVEKLDLPDRDAARARLITSLFVDAMAPSNNFFANPAAMKTLYETGGKSAVNGVKNLVTDMVKNGGLPASVDESKFTVGENIAVTPGNVVFRNEVIELIHYTANTDKVYRRPLLIVPPQINKYYSVDLSPGKSMIEFLLANGIQPYCISWRNPTAEHKDWDFQTYIEALDEACEATLEITGSDSVNIMGSCSGGITLSAYLGWLADQKQSKKINAVILAVCVLDTMQKTDNDMAALVTPETVMAAKQMSATRGVLDGQEMAKMFAWMRPNDLIWNYWINNYLLGNAPPAFDVLYWNADTTRLPAGLHSDFLDMIFTNPFMNPGVLSIGGHPIDMSKVKHETYVIAGTTDHITPWHAVYQTARLFGPKTTFILSNSGHLQSLLNPPGNPKSWFMKAPAKAEDGDTWAETAQKNEGTWWLDWADFLKKKSDSEVDAPKEAGSKANPVLGPAPGTYIFED
ncbi:MAG: alpha/beta fold hydrolase [Rhizobiaceae bacterium]|nr:alpha/beta fold hydrolase [Rhizobiaceae bacterium]